MKKHIGILFPSSQCGGVYQYTQSIADSLIAYSDTAKYSIVHHKGERPELFLGQENRELDYIVLPHRNLSLARKIHHLGSLRLRMYIFCIKHLDPVLKKHGVDLVIVPTPFSFTVPFDTPYIAGIPDLMHKYYPDFPDYPLTERITRDTVYAHYARRSLLNVVDSEQGSEDVERFLRVKKEKNRIIPYIPPSYVYKFCDMTQAEAEKIMSRYQLPERFIFYPGQFWFQKNHARLIQALHLIKKKYKVVIPLVLVGDAKVKSRKGVYRDLFSLIEHLGINDQVVHLGYIRDKEMVACYKKATALIAPPFQGPTTIPPLEAMMLGTPVATVNCYDLPRQIGEAGLFFDPLSVEDIADKIYQLWQQEHVRKELIMRGREKMSVVTQKNYASQWEKVIKEAFTIYEQQS